MSDEAILSNCSQWNLDDDEDDANEALDLSTSSAAENEVQNK